MRELQTREISPEDYDLLLQLESQQHVVPLPKFLALALEKQSLHDKGTRYEALQTTPQCAFCNLRLEDRGKGMILRNCDHCLHKSCLEDMFRLKKSKCPTCDLNLADGFDKSISVAKVKRAPGVKKKGTNEEAKKVL